MFFHLDAARELIRLLQSTAYPLPTVEENELLVLGVETYQYLTLVNSVGPPSRFRNKGTLLNRLPFSPSSLTELGSFGSIFNGYHELLNLIPELNDLWLTAGDGGSSSSSLLGDTFSSMGTREDRYSSLRRKITQWRPSMRSDACFGPQQQEGDCLWYTVAELWRHSLAVYLEAARAGPRPIRPPARQVIAEHVRRAVHLTISTNVIDSQHAVTLSWPMMIIGSCLDCPADRSLLMKFVRGTRLQTWNSLCGLLVLEYLWQEEDALLFGPYGLFMTMQKHGLDYSFA